MNFIRTPHVEYLYQELLSFLYDSIIKVEKSTNTPSKNTAAKLDSRAKKTSSSKHGEKESTFIITKMELNSEDPNEAKYIYLRKFYLALLLHFGMVCYNNDLNKEKKLIDESVSKLSLCFSRKAIEASINTTTISKSDLKDIESYTALIKVFNLIIKYLNQFKKKVLSSNCAASSSLTTNIEHILKENNSIEVQLVKEFEGLNGLLKKGESFYQYWIANNLFELFHSVIAGLFDQAGYSKYLQESLIECFASISQVFAENIQVS